MQVDWSIIRLSNICYMQRMFKRKRIHMGVEINDLGQVFRS